MTAGGSIIGAKNSHFWLEFGRNSTRWDSDFIFVLRPKGGRFPDYWFKSIPGPTIRYCFTIEFHAEYALAIAENR